MFELTAEHLQALVTFNEFPLDLSTPLVFFGLRGCLPLDTQDFGFRSSHHLTLADVDFRRARCTIGQWRPASATFAIFPGSTIPHQRYVAGSRTEGGEGTNQLLSGFYDDYRKGRHRSDKPTGHDAFRQTMARPVLRTEDDLDYDGDDRVEIVNAFDNLHAAFCAGTERDYSSAGCQVVVGFPKCQQLGNREGTGPWHAFQKEAYALAQDSFAYFLLGGREALRVATPNRPAGMERIRFGSRGPRSRRVQEALSRKQLYEGRSDGHFVGRSVRALIAFQRQTFGPGGVDGVCGPQTAAALGIDWERSSPDLV